MDIFKALGGIGTLVKMYVLTLIDEKEEDVQKVADRLMTISEKDHRKACKALGIKDESDIVAGLALARKAGDAFGDYLGFLALNSAHRALD